MEIINGVLKSIKDDDVINGIVKIPEDVIMIDDFVFHDCRKLQEVIIPDNVKIIGIATFMGCSNLKKIRIPNSVKEIRGGAFSHCTSLKNLLIPKGVKVIRKLAFEACKNIQNARISEGVEYIGDNLFLNCTNLKRVKILSDIKEIGDDIFGWCRNLRKITYKNENIDLLYFNGEKARLLTQSLFKDIRIYECSSLFNRQDTFFVIEKDGVFGKGKTLKETFADLTSELLWRKDIDEYISKIRKNKFITREDYQKIMDVLFCGVKIF